MWISILSSKGPEIRFWYLVTTAGAHPQAFCGSLNQPQGQGYTQSDIFFLHAKTHQGDFEGNVHEWQEHKLSASKI
jgi:hypothetical protein